MNKNFVRFFSALLLVTLILSACSSAATPTPAAQPTVTLKISGSGTITAVLEALKPAFEAATPGYRLEILTGTGTGGGVTGIVEGVLDAAAMARPPKDEEAAKGVQFFEMGLGAEVILVHPSVTGVTSLTHQQIIDIFSGQITNWSAVGGPNMDIILYVRDADDSSVKGLRKAVLGEIPFPETATMLTSQGEMLTALEGTPGAVGIASWPTVLATKADVLGIAIKGVKADDPSYPILGTMGIGYLTDRQSDVQPLLDWLSSVEGQAALQALGFITPQ